MGRKIFVGAILCYSLNIFLNVNLMTQQIEIEQSVIHIILNGEVSFYQRKFMYICK